jgi:hypothetical protein
MTTFTYRSSLNYFMATTLALLGKHGLQFIIPVNYFQAGGRENCRIKLPNAPYLAAINFKLIVSSA